MSIEGYQPKRVFTIEEANAHLPLVKSIAGDLSRTAKKLVKLRDQYNRIIYTEENSSDTAEALEQQMLSLEQKHQGYLQELIDLGIEPKNGVEGLVDFPAEMEGRIVYLCWKLGEAELTHWHEIDAGFAGRKPLASSPIS